MASKREVWVTASGEAFDSQEAAEAAEAAMELVDLLASQIDIEAAATAYDVAKALVKFWRADPQSAEKIVWLLQKVIY